MTEATFHQQNTRFAISVHGHAGYDAKGHDIVCAAVSMLTQALIRWMQIHEDQIQHVNACTLNEGAVHLDVEAHPEHAKTMRVALDVILCGFELLQERYPGHVKVILLSDP